MSVTLGLNGISGVGHDAGAALVVDGTVVAAVEEERLVRIKRAYGLPPLRAMKEVLDLARVSIADVDTVSYPWLPRAMGVVRSELEETIRNWCQELAPCVKIRPRVQFIEHHEAHAWSGLAFVPGGIRGRRIGVLVLDGSGESTSGACYRYHGRLSLEWRLAQQASVGIYYEAVTHYLGFGWGDEGKTMGLAAYGRDQDLAMPALADLRGAGTLEARSSHDESPLHVHEELRRGIVEEFLALHGSELSFNRRADVAFAAQQVVAARILGYVSELVKDVEVLILAGGVALNCSINAHVAQLCARYGVELVVPPPASDTGVALGAAIATIGESEVITPLCDAFLGRAFAHDAIEEQLTAEGAPIIPLDLHELAAEIVGRSHVCGWFDGRGESGPRALGNRSIIAGADSTATRDRINQIKGRESWRPLSPSITDAEFERSFCGAVASPYMLIAARVAPGQAQGLRGVIHVDDTSRPQVVSDAGSYRDLLEEIGRLSGKAAVTCTSFNRAGEPMVYSPLDAIRSARSIGLDMLAGDGWCSRIKPE